MRVRFLAISSLGVFGLLLSGLALPGAVSAQSRGKWYMHEGGGIKKFKSCNSSHGHKSVYALASIPAWPGKGWKPAPNQDHIGLSRRSSLCGKVGCRCGGDFSYFRNTVSIPANFKLTKFEIELRGMDDGTRVTIVNSKYPKGVTPSGAYVYLGGTLTQDLKAFAVAGETNVILLTHVDDCCSECNLREAYIRVNGKRVPQGCQPSAEKCNGRDDDCDGRIDNKKGTTDPLTRACKNACGPGTQTCIGKTWGKCNAPSPSPEVCDGKDNDCDGKVDNGALCPGGQACVAGVCLRKCRSGECPSGFVCKEDMCRPTRGCKDVECPVGKVCRAGGCVDPCAQIKCPDGFVCEKGSCVEENCYHQGCKKGWMCREGKCVNDPCTGVVCAGGESCREGKCVGSCAGVACKADEKCRAGKCVADPCAGVTCGAGEVCDGSGSCAKDPCAGVICGRGRICRAGRCVDDPCLAVHCAEGQVCRGGDCWSAKAGSSKQADGGSGASGDGGEAGDGGAGAAGCVCSADEDNGVLALWLLFGVLPVMLCLRRRAGSV